MVGIDIVEIPRIRHVVDRYGDRFLSRVFTDEEIAYARGRRKMEEPLAGRFAVKEAFMKAVGRRLPWRDIEVCQDKGRPFVRYGGKEYLGVSISHERAYAVAVVFIEGENG
jgi:holo-[acyl-carrier protein] synthase